MRSFIKRVIITGIGLSMLANNIILAEQRPALETIYQYVSEEEISKGLVYEHKEKLTEAGWVDIHVLKMDTTEETLTIDVLRDVETYALGNKVSVMANQDSRFVGGINGSFFSMGTMLGEVKGVEVNDQEMTYGIDDYNYYGQEAANILLDVNGGVSFDFLNLSLSVTTGSGKSIRIQGINSHSVFADPIIFNRQAYDDLDYVDTLDDLYKVVVDNDVVTMITDKKEHIEIPEDGYVITFPVEDPNLYRNEFKVGTTVSVNQKSNFDPKDLSMAMPGGGYIIRNGLIADDGLITGEDVRHPRTAVGVTEDGKTLIAMVVDGRGESIGATHRELADYMLEYDVYNAIHMDGGGSSTMVMREAGSFTNETVNTPSDGHERSVVNGLGFVLDAPRTDEYDLILEADKNRTFVNNKVHLSLSAKDLNYNPVEVDDSQIVWTMTGGYGTVEGMNFTPTNAGHVSLTANYDNKSTTIELDVVDTLIDLEVSPKVIHMDDGKQKITVVGTDEEGYKSVIDSDLLNWSIDSEVGTIVDGMFIPGANDKTSEIVVSYGDVKEYAYVISGNTENMVTDFTDESVETLVYPDSVDGEVGIIQQDASALKINYGFDVSDTAQAVYAVFEGININSKVDNLILRTNDFPTNVLVKAHLQDKNNEQYTITFKDDGDGSAKAAIPSGIAYPIALSRLYTVVVSTEEPIEGSFTVTNILSSKKNGEQDISDIMSVAPLDDLYNDFPEDGFSISIFGATGGRNRLLDDVLLSKVYDTFNESDFSIYAGSTDVDNSKITNEHIIYQNGFEVTDLNDARIISLAMGEGGMVKTDSSQWRLLNSALSSTVQDSIILLGTEALLNNTDSTFTREGELIHKTISDFAKLSGKNVFYINASGYNYKLNYYEGIRYIDLNGLWYTIDNNNAVDLYDSFKALSLTFTDGDVSYKVEDLYPKTTIGE